MGMFPRSGGVVGTATLRLAESYLSSSLHKLVNLSAFQLCREKKVPKLPRMMSP